MSNYCFFDSAAEQLCDQSNLKDLIESYAHSNQKQVYALSKPLSKDDSEYDYNEAIVIFASNLKPLFVNCGDDYDAFEEFIEDFLEDFSYLAAKYKYREKIGRRKSWQELFQVANSENINFDKIKTATPKESRTVDLLTSLAVGSINDIKKVKLETNGLLDSIKSKIVLFDTDQTSFVFKTDPVKKFVIQGLAGSGKTELLLHKMKEVYSHENDAKIAFTCYNKILASSMRARIPEFFDFMRVERQIEWNEKLFCFHAWGGAANPYSGMYRLICHFYKIPFGAMMNGSFDDLCKRAISDIKSLKSKKEYAFDYTFIDESQDFEDSFIELCELVTSKKVFVAGDVFQNIFRPIDDRVNKANMILTKCYRTDPKNLMFSHAVGMGLFEKPVLRWLNETEWAACGYNYKVDNGRAHLSRSPLRRFEDIPDNFQSTFLHHAEQDSGLKESILHIIESIRENHGAQQGDIAIILLDKERYIYDLASELKHSLKIKYNWESNLSYESKVNDSSKLFISNINNAKGLEFPFVVCVTKHIRKTASFRNALYTMMARSFLESHLVVKKSILNYSLKEIENGLRYLTENNELNVRIPEKEEIENQKQFLVIDESESIESYVKTYCASRGASPRLTAKLVETMSKLGEVDDFTDFDDEDFQTILDMYFKKYFKL